MGPFSTEARTHCFLSSPIVLKWNYHCQSVLSQTWMKPNQHHITLMIQHMCKCSRHCWRSLAAIISCWPATTTTMSHGRNRQYIQEKAKREHRQGIFSSLSQVAQDMVKGSHDCHILGIKKLHHTPEVIELPE